MDGQRLPSASYAKTITNYSTTVKRGCITWLDRFSAGSSTWKIGIGILQQGEGNCLCLHISVADDDEDELPKGWYREAYFKLTLRQIIPPFMFPMVIVKQMEFNKEKRGFGYPYATPPQLQKGGYLVNDSVKIQASVVVLRSFPMAWDAKVSVIDKFKQYVSPLARYLEVVEPGSTKPKVAGPPPKELKKALKGCILSPYEPNSPSKLQETLWTLKLKDEESEKIPFALMNYMEDYWTLQRANSNCQVSNLYKALKITGLKKWYRKNIRMEGKLEELVQEGERLKERIKEASKKEEVEKEKELILEFERVEDKKSSLLLGLEDCSSTTESWWSACRSAVEDVAKVEKEKRAAEERLSISTLAWNSCMKSLLDQLS